MWNEPSPEDKTKPIFGASEQDMLEGAVDAVCSLLENRGYQGGIHNYQSIIEIAKKNPPHKVQWMLKAVREMSIMRQPNLKRVNPSSEFLNIGLDHIVYDAILDITNDAVKNLKAEHGYFIKIKSPLYRLKV